MEKCTRCGAPGAYLGLGNPKELECQNPSCEAYSPSHPYRDRAGQLPEVSDGRMEPLAREPTEPRVRDVRSRYPRSMTARMIATPEPGRTSPGRTCWPLEKKTLAGGVTVNLVAYAQVPFRAEAVALHVVRGDRSGVYLWRLRLDNRDVLVLAGSAGRPAVVLRPEEPMPLAESRTLQVGQQVTAEIFNWNAEDVEVQPLLFGYAKETMSTNLLKPWPRTEREREADSRARSHSDAAARARKDWVCECESCEETRLRLRLRGDLCPLCNRPASEEAPPGCAEHLA